MSSSGHLSLVPRLLGWPCAGLAGNARKTFEVALHAGSAPAVALAAAREPRLGVTGLALTLAPPALAGLALERRIESRLGSTRSVALAQIAAGAVLVLADLRPQARSSPRARDFAAVGLAQAVALVPGVSRSGAALSAGRLSGLTRRAAASLALASALPVTAGAGALKGARLASGGVGADLHRPLAAGAAAALVSAFVSLPLARRTPSPKLLGCYRVALGAACLKRLVVLA